MKKLKLLPVGNLLINDHAALKDGIDRKIGRRWDPQAKWYVPTGSPQEVEAQHEYVLAVKQGDLMPADAETAKYCGVPFTPPNDKI